MATAESLGGRRVPTSPEPKGDKTVTFVGSDGNELEVLSSISKQGLKILRKQGYRKKSEVLREQQKSAEEKEQEAENTGNEPTKAWSRKEIDDWAAQLDPPLDTTGASSKDDALKLIEDALADEDDDEDDSDNS